MAGIYRKYKQITKGQFDKGEYTKNELIENYIPLALAIARKFPSKYIERNEAISIGLCELTRCINNCKIGNQKDLTKLVQKSIFNRIKDHCLRYYGRSVIRTKGRKCKPVETVSLSKNITDHCYRHYFKIDLDDTINKIVKNSIERVIINRIIEGGYTLEDIAKETGISRSYVGLLRSNLLEKMLCELLK